MTLSQWLAAEFQVEPSVVAQLENQVRAEVDAAVDFALAEPFPEEMEVDHHVFA